MSRLDDIQKELESRMAAIEKRINGGETSGKSALRSAASNPTLSSADIEAVRSIALQVMGFAPGSELSNLPADFASELREIMLAIAEVAKRESMPIGSATLTVVRDKTSVGQQNLPYGPLSVLQDGLPASDADAIGDIAYKVARSAAYYRRRLGIDRFDGIAVLWADVEAAYDISSNRLAVAYAQNAFSSPQKRGGRLAVLCFSPLVTDLPVVCHELTHSVSHDLIGWGEYYVGESGAVNESCSDIFAKFAEFAWNGFDPSDRQRWRMSTFRDMAHPSSMTGGSGWKPADYYLEPADGDNPKSGWLIVQTPDDTNDRGGVHINNGVLTRLCFLLCEGESFTRKDGIRFDVPPIGLERTEELFVRTFLSGGYLTAKPSVYDVYRAIVQSAQDLAFTTTELQTLQSACAAVNIVPAESGNFQGRSHSMSFEKRSLRGMGDDVAEALARAYAEELGLTVRGCGVVLEDEATTGGVRGAERSVRLRQTYDGLPVFGATAVAHVDGTESVTFLNSGFSRDLGSVRTAESLDAAAAQAIAREESGGLSSLACERVVFDPALFGTEGAPVVAWHVTSGLPGNAESHRVIDAQTGRVLFSAPLHIN